MPSDSPPPDAPAVRIERPRSEPPAYLIERRLLCERIEQLESELRRERRRRQQIVEQYERLLGEQRAETERERDAGSGLLERLF